MQHQFAAINKLYEAASTMPNAALMERYRRELHDLLDVQLDKQNEIAEYNRRIINSL